eukprot:scaffold78515_cov46-Attheya_sp.AAC.2
MSIWSSSTRGIMGSRLLQQQQLTAPVAVAAAATLQQSSRSYWKEVLRPIQDPKSKEWKYEKPEKMAMRSEAATRSEGILARHSRYVEYEKPWMRNKRLKSEKIYKSQKRGVEELKKYIEFVNENKNDY